jgi:hypothetical protein
MRSRRREIPLKDLKVFHPEKGAGIANPVVISSEDELKESPILKDAADAIKKKVDFSKEKLVLFNFPGKDGGKMVTKAELARDKGDAVAKPAIHFQYTGGEIGIPRTQVLLYVIPRGAEVKTSVAK